MKIILILNNFQVDTWPMESYFILSSRKFYSHISERNKIIRNLPYCLIEIPDKISFLYGISFVIEIADIFLPI